MLKFWIWWADKPKLRKLSDGQTISLDDRQTTDEGWTFEAHMYTRHGDTIYRRVFRDGRDCDGRMSSDDYCFCVKQNLRTYRDGNYLYPKWERTDHEVYDEEAQKAGY